MIERESFLKYLGVTLDDHLIFEKTYESCWRWGLKNAGGFYKINVCKTFIKVLYTLLH